MREKPILVYKNSGIELYCGNSTTTRISRTSDVFLLTDPPYGININTNNSRFACSTSKASIATINNIKDYPKLIGDDKPFNPEHLLIYPKLTLFGANHYHNKLSNTKGWIIWDKTGCGCNIGDQSDAEMAWTNYLSVVRIYNHLWKGMLKESERREKRVHPTQKPICLMRWILSNWYNNSLVYDPYCGAGSSLIAAYLLGLPAIGIEISPEYCEIAKARLQSCIEHKKDLIGTLMKYAIPEGYMFNGETR